MVLIEGILTRSAAVPEPTVIGLSLKCQRNGFFENLHAYRDDGRSLIPWAMPFYSALGAKKGAFISRYTSSTTLEEACPFPIARSNLLYEGRGRDGLTPKQSAFIGIGSDQDKCVIETAFFI
jgi:hypothetical protein